MRDILMRDIITEALTAGARHGGVRTQSDARVAIDAGSLVPRRAAAASPAHTVSIGSIEASGQPVPRIQLRYPGVFHRPASIACSAYMRGRLPKATVAHVGIDADLFPLDGSHPYGCRPA